MGEIEKMLFRNFLYKPSNRFYLYNKGNEYTDITGGWISVATYSGNGGYLSYCFYKGPDYLQYGNAECYNGQDGVSFVHYDGATFVGIKTSETMCVNPIDIKNFTQISIEFEIVKALQGNAYVPGYDILLSTTNNYDYDRDNNNPTVKIKCYRGYYYNAHRNKRLTITGYFKNIINSYDKNNPVYIYLRAWGSSINNAALVLKTYRVWLEYDKSYDPYREFELSDEPDRFYLYNEGNEYIDITGGWVIAKINTSSYRFYSENAFYKGPDYLQYGDPMINNNGDFYGYASCAVRTTNPIDVSSYSKICIEYEVYDAGISSSTNQSTGRTHVDILLSRTNDYTINNNASPLIKNFSDPYIANVGFPRRTTSTPRVDTSGPDLASRLVKYQDKKIFIGEFSDIDPENQQYLQDPVWIYLKEFSGYSGYDSLIVRTYKVWLE